MVLAPPNTENPKVSLTLSNRTTLSIVIPVRTAGREGGSGLDVGCGQVTTTPLLRLGCDYTTNTEYSIQHCTQYWTPTHRYLPTYIGVRTYVFMCTYST